MIRINLLPVKEVKKKKVRKEFFLLVGILVALDIMVMMSWGTASEDGLKVVRTRNKQMQDQVDSLKEAKKQMEDREQNKKLLEAQNFIFDKLKYDKIGPSNLLLYISYALTKPENSAQNREEIKKREVLGWNVDWDADSVWLVHITEKEGLVRLRGEARNHEDVAEFLRRLESGVFFYKPELVKQEKHFHQQLETHYVEFEIVADLNYNLDGYPISMTGVAPKKK